MTFRSVVSARVVFAAGVFAAVASLAATVSISAQRDKSGSGAKSGSSSTPPSSKGGTAAPRTATHATAQPRSGTTSTSPAGPHARERNGSPVVGTAVPRPPGSGAPVIFVPAYYGFYPFGWGGLGLAGYYGGYFGGYGYDVPYPYDPLYAPGQWYPAGGSVADSSDAGDDGALRLRVKPRDASVFIDGYLVGTVDDFDGWLQRVHLRAGAHHVEIQKPGYRTLAVDVRILPGQTITYRADLTKQP
jgi:hypothetical protein